MKRLLVLFFGLTLTLFLLPRPAHANVTSVCTTTVTGSISCTGSLSTPEDFFAEPFTLTAASTVAVQTYGFGGTALGYTNAAGNVISGGGFDSLVALFSGTGSSDVVSDLPILTDVSGNPIASIPGSTQFFAGCPPAAPNAVIGCGDNKLVATLTPGNYTLLLSDANYVPYAVSPGPMFGCSTLSDCGAPYFGDLSGGAFTTCDTIGDCIADNGNFAVDITGLPPVVTPEPGTFLLYGSGLILMGFLYRRRPFAPAE
jgi:hypothetical protein